MVTPSFGSCRIVLPPYDQLHLSFLPFEMKSLQNMKAYLNVDIIS
jgi:hypothetical protein